MSTLEKLLITDLDGTLIPLTGDAQNANDLDILSTQLQRNNVNVAFCTGRHLASVLNAIESFLLPLPQWIIADVGTSVYEQQPSGEYTTNREFLQHLDSIVASMPLTELQFALSAFPRLRIQENEKQGRFKLSYYTSASELKQVVDQVETLLKETSAPYNVISSVDPFNGDGLIDLLPAGVSKAHAVAWLVERSKLPADKVAFAGDSGNDLAVFESGLQSIVVGNADRSLADHVTAIHRQHAWQGKVYLAKRTATSGVLEGCRYYGLIDTDV